MYRSTESYLDFGILNLSFLRGYETRWSQSVLIDLYEVAGGPEPEY
jgi:hypothetical protein